MHKTATPLIVHAVCAMFTKVCAMVRELNPNHPVTRELREQYHKLLAFTMWKFGLRELQITSADLEAFVADHPDGINVALEPKGHVLKVSIVSDAEGARLARKEGGLPT